MLFLRKVRVKLNKRLREQGSEEEIRVRKKLRMARGKLGEGQKETVKRKGNGYRRNATLQYFFEVGGVRHQVCKIFFLNTLCISEVYVKTALAKKGASGIVSPDNRGKKEPANKLDEGIRETVRSHIRSFPVFESHYSRERSSRTYLGNHLSISKMYNMYIEQCQEDGKDDRSIAKEWLYHDISIPSSILDLRNLPMIRVTTAMNLPVNFEIILSQKKRGTKYKLRMTLTYLKQTEGIRRRKRIKLSPKIKRQRKKL
uniref:Elongation factor 4 n=1 Tax=Lygus hesperus TaxID=30085 RepID=A0A0A9XH44_LYGHE